MFSTPPGLYQQVSGVFLCLQFYHFFHMLTRNVTLSIVRKDPSMDRSEAPYSPGFAYRCKHISKAGHTLIRHTAEWMKCTICKRLVRS